MAHGLIKLADGSSTSDAAHRKALHDKTAKLNRFALLHGGVNVPEPVQNLVSALNGFNGQIDTDAILWRTRPNTQTTITYRNIDVALLLPQGIHTLKGFKIGSLSYRPDTLASSIKKSPAVEEKMKIGNLNDVISVLCDSSGDSWDLRTHNGSTHIRLNQKPLYLVTPTFEIKTLDGETTIADLNEGTKGNPENADVYGVADKIIAHFMG